VVGDLVSVGVRDAGDEAAGAEAVQVIGDRVGWCCPQFGDQWAEIFVGEAVGLEPKQRQRGEQGMAALLTQAQAWVTGAGRGGDGCGDGAQGIGPR
jgi:hypothetical protein